MAPWKLPLIVAAIVVPIVLGFYVGGAGVGAATGALAAVAIVVYAARQKPRGTISSAPARDARRHVLLVITSPVEEPAEIARVIEAGRLGEGADVLVLVPARIGFLDRWASDVEGSRRAAQDRLVATVAALAKGGVEAEARVGDEELIQAVEDRLQTYPATDVVVVTAPERSEADAAELAELEQRLAARFLQLEIG